jgi:hypothetical protein
MGALVIDRGILPEPIFSFIGSERIKVSKRNGSVILSPVADGKKTVKAKRKKKQDIEELINEMQGMFSDGRMSTEDFIRQKRLEMELEEY